MKFVRKLLFVLLCCGLMMPLYSAPKKSEKETKNEIKCPNCGKKIKLDKLKKDSKKKKKKSKKNKKKKKDKDNKAKDKQDKAADKPAVPAKLNCPKCKKAFPNPEADKANGTDKAEQDKASPDSASEAPADQNAPDAENAADNAAE